MVAELDEGIGRYLLGPDLLLDPIRGIGQVEFLTAQFPSPPNRTVKDLLVAAVAADVF